MPYQKRGGGRGGGDGRQQQQKQDSQHLGDGFDQGPGPHGGHGGGGRSGGHLSEQALITLIQDIQDLRKREDAMATLSKHRDSVKKLAVLLWHSFGIIPILVDEVISVYEHLCPEEGLQPAVSNRVCNALALLQCTASSPETRGLFLAAQLPLYLYPLLATTNRARSYEYLRLTSLGVIGALVKTDEPDVVRFLISTEMIPLCLCIMEHGTELSKTVATFIVQKILLADDGLAYICSTYGRFSHIAMVLSRMVHALAQSPSGRLLKHVVRCYHRLSDNPRARDALRSCLPDKLRDGTIENTLRSQKDEQTLAFLQKLLVNLGLASPSTVPALPTQQQQAQ